MQDEVKKSTPFEQKFHLFLSYLFNLVILAFIILLGQEEPEFSISSMGYVYVIIMYLVYSYIAGKFVSGLYKFVTPQRQWITRSKFIHHLNKIFGLLISAAIFFFACVYVTGNLELLLRA